jgi:Tfp pilus assembly protein PilX
MRLRLNQRGSSLVMSMIVVLVIAAIGVAVVRYGSREVAGATAGRKEAALASCAEAARSLLMSQWKLLGAHGVTAPALNVLLDSASNTRVQGGHYGQDPTSSGYWNAASQTWVNNIQVIPLDPLTVGSSYQMSDLTNRMADPVRSYRVVAHCTQGDGRQAEVEFGVQYGL